MSLKFLIAILISIAALFFAVREYFEIFRMDPLWSWYSIPWELLRYPAAAILASFILWILNWIWVHKKQRKESVFKSQALVWAVNCLIFLGFFGNLKMWLFFGLFAFAFLIGILPFQSVLERILKEKVNFSRSLFFQLIVLHHILFILAIFGKLTHFIFVSLILTVLAAGLAVALRKYKDLSKLVIRSLTPISWTEIFLLNCLFMVLALSFVTMSAPQTYTDGIVYRIPYLQEILRTGQLPFHYFNWNWVMGHPVTLVLSPYYAMFGEIGAAWALFLMSIVGAFVFSEVSDWLKISKNSRLLMALLLSTTAPIWLEITSIYYDLMIVFFAVEAWCLLKKGLDQQSTKYLFLCAASAGFSYAIKPNGLIAVFVFFLVLLAHQFKQFFFLFRFRSMIIFAAGIVAVVLPWGWWAYNQSGNPFFPFLSQISRPPFDRAMLFEKNLYPEVVFSRNPIELLFFPFRLLFASVGKFGEYLPGSFGPIWSIFLAVLIVPIVMRTQILASQLSEWRLVRFILVLMPIGIYITCAANGFSTFRYWMAFFIVLTMALAFVFDHGWIKKKNLLSGLLGLLSLVAFVLVVARNNYGLPRGLGDQYWSQKMNENEFWKEKTHQIEDFINKRVDVSQTVVAENFQYIKLLKVPAFYISHPNSLMGQLLSLELFEELKNKYHVRFWIQDTRSTVPLIKEISDKYLQDENIVIGDGYFRVFDLWNKRREPLHQVEWSRQIADTSSGKTSSFIEQEICTSNQPCQLKLKIDKREKMQKGEVHLGAGQAQAQLIVEFLFYDQQRKIIERKSIGSEIMDQPFDFTWYTRYPENADMLEIWIHPWRPSDGSVQVEEVHLKMFE